MLADLVIILGLGFALAVALIVVAMRAGAVDTGKVEGGLSALFRTLRERIKR